MNDAQEIERLKQLINRDRTGLAAALSAVRGFAASYGWIARGEWGSYSHVERSTDTLRREVRHLLALIEETAAAALRESGQRADAAFRLRPDLPPEGIDAAARLAAYERASHALVTAIGVALTMEGQVELGLHDAMRELRALRAGRPPVAIFGGAHNG